MRLRDIKLTNYRNCRDLELDLNSAKILIIGKNAQGKTNILESIYLLSALKSQRTSNNVELINFDAEYTEINANLLKANTDIELDYSYSREKKRELKLNKVKTIPKNFKTVLKTVLFSTADLLLLRGNPSDRRDWLDSAISQIYPAGLFFRYTPPPGGSDRRLVSKNVKIRSVLLTFTISKYHALLLSKAVLCQHERICSVIR